MHTGTRQRMQGCGSGNDSDDKNTSTYMALRSIHGLIVAVFIERSAIRIIHIVKVHTCTCI